MRTEFSADLLATDHGARANEILRACVHCGFCNATCPTYQVTGDELDGPRGRIYLMRDLLQTGESLARTRQHLDRCLTCRACETTCPSGVQYGELAEIVRFQIGTKRSGWQGFLRSMLAWMVPAPGRLRVMARLGKTFRWLLPGSLRKLLPRQIGRGVAATTGFRRQVLLLNGCAQQVATSATNIALQTILTERGIGTLVLSDEECCGSLGLHAGDEGLAVERIRRNVDRIYPELESVEAVISTASGCGLTIKEWGRVLQHDPDYAERAAAISEHTHDASEWLLAQLPGSFEKARDVERVAIQTPCTLQHGQRIVGVVDELLESAGYELVDVADAHLCCGSAGSYSALQPKLASELGRRKAANLEAAAPDVIASANVGCQGHLANYTRTPIAHWIELLK